MQIEQWKGKRVAIVTVVSPCGDKGGAERFYEGLRAGFEEIGCKPSLIKILAEEPDFQTILENYERARLLDVSEFDFIVSTKVPSYAIRHPRHVLYLVHTVRVFDDMFEATFGNPTEEHYRQRAELHKLDLDSLLGAKARFAIGHEVVRRLYKWRGIQCDVLHPPLAFNSFRPGPVGDYFFLPGRLHDWKRVDLIIRAVKSSNLPLRFLIAGDGPAENELRQLAAGDPGIEFLGRVDDQQLVELYSNCLAVPFVPIREDYGYITLEAFASGKPVLTCSDSGEPCHFVSPYKTGLIAQPDAQSVSEALDWLWTHRDEAAQMGQNGKDLIAAMSWGQTARDLAEAAYEKTSHRYKRKTKVIVFDMQPIDPPVGGGRLRLLGLYHNLGPDIECTYVGTYDWPGEHYRDHMLSDNLREINVPLSDQHHAAAAHLAEQMSGKVAIDLAFSQQAHLSPDFLATVHEQMGDADVIVFSHPWVYPLVKHRLRPEQVIIYDSQNVEGYLRAQLLDEANPVEAQLLRQVIEDENALGCKADWILTCSHEDLLRFHRLYGFDPGKMRVVPNGVMAFRDPPSTEELKRESRRRLGLDPIDFLAIFIGSPYGPNIEAAKFIESDLAPALPDVTFVIAGGVGQCIESKRENVIITGQLDEDKKRSWLQASDIAVNPMMSGSGTNIKMFDFMAMALPIVTTSIGARGIDTGGFDCLKLSEASRSAFSEAINKLRDTRLREEMGKQGRLCVEVGYSWERISRQLGCFLQSRQRTAGHSKPLFSVIVATNGAHDRVKILLRSLQAQIDRDFEVVLVDRSELNWQGAENSFGFSLTYFRSPGDKLGRALNTGAMIAQGEIIAFLDECSKAADRWLLNSRKYFDSSEVVAVGGIVCAEGFEAPELQLIHRFGMGGEDDLSVNLLIRSGAFQYLGGYPTNYPDLQAGGDGDFWTRLNNLGSFRHADDVILFKKSEGIVDKHDHNAFQAKGDYNVAHFSTAGLKCGIGEYTNDIIRSFSSIGVGNVIMNCDALDSSYSSIPIGVPAKKAWFFDNKTWRDSRVYAEAIDMIKAADVNRVLVQYHPGFYSPEILLDFVSKCIAESLKVAIICHKYERGLVDAFQACNRFGVPILSHSETEVKEARRQKVVLEVTQIGTNDSKEVRLHSIFGRDFINKPPVISTNGFLREHKGVQELIKALPMVRKRFPGTKLVIQTPLYPSEDSRTEARVCRDLLEEMNLQENVVFDQSYLDKKELLSRLADSDLAVFPYRENSEGSSAAAADALASGLPIIVSDSEIFDSVRDVAVTTETEPMQLANTMVSLFNNRDRYQQQAQRAFEYAKEHSWINISKELLRKCRF